MSKELSLFEMPNIYHLQNHEGSYGKLLDIRTNLTGYTRREAKAMVLDDYHGRTNCMADFDSTERQKEWLEKFGVESSGSKLIDQAKINDVCEQLDWDVLRYEELALGSVVVHVREKNKKLVIRTIKPGEKCKFEGTGDTCNLRMLRRYRSDGDYTKTGIPNVYFRKGWLER